MSTSMRILTYNTKLRSLLMEVGFPPSIPPEYDAPLRAKIIADRILHHATEIDVVCLNEVFDEPSRDILSAELLAQFPYQVTKADTYFTGIVSPTLSDVVSSKVWDLTFGPFADVAGLAQGKAEDSGLFLASRFPFVRVPASPAAIALGNPGALLAGVPVVLFTMYVHSTDTDQHAAKGVLYVRLKPPGASERHVFISHAQADTTRPEEHALERGGQLEQATAFIEHCLGESPPYTQEVFFLGDLNIIGNELKQLVPGQAVEWERLCGTAGAPWHDAMVDRWRRDQCPGGGTGRSDPGYTADVGFAPTRQRLDYVFTSATSQLAVQHLRVDRKLADPAGLVGFVSDHQPVLADVREVTPHCTPATAYEVPPDVDWDITDSLIDGMVRWYRFDVPGTYDVRLDVLGADTAYEIYVGDDFSSPQPTYRLMSNPERGLRYVLVAPFFIKVFLVERHSECTFTLSTHRHEGRDWRDAIVLVPGRPVDEAFPSAPFNIDSTDADWDDGESKWFLVETPLVPLTKPIDLRVSVHPEAGDELGLNLGRWDGVQPPVSFVEQAGPDTGSSSIPWQAGQEEHFMVLVQRSQGPGAVVPFRIELSTTLSLLVTRPAVRTSLVCQVETSGWGADDIALQLRADGVLVADLPNGVIGDFEEHTVKHLGDKLPAFVPYTDGIEVRVIEEDTFDPDDVGTGTVPLVDQVAGTPGFTVLDRPLDGSVEGDLTIRVDDGRYGFGCRIARWHPEA